jgi:hypothetical protein
VRGRSFADVLVRSLVPGSSVLLEEATTIPTPRSSAASASAASAFPPRPSRGGVPVARAAEAPPRSAGRKRVARSARAPPGAGHPAWRWSRRSACPRGRPRARRRAPCSSRAVTRAPWRSRGGAPPPPLRAGRRGSSARFRAGRP